MTIKYDYGHTLVDFILLCPHPGVYFQFCKVLTYDIIWKS
jgi:hypothetical protein